jgi:NAD(P)-binding Rossmann-like domain
VILLLLQERPIELNVPSCDYSQPPIPPDLSIPIEGRQITERALEADYVIVGAGAVAMAFADTLLTDTEASIIMVDRGHKPGGHWNDSYPFVGLHGPSINYGVNSRPLGTGRIDKGLHELAGGHEICAYFDQMMRQRFLPSGRVTYLPLSNYTDDGVVTSPQANARW